MPDDLKKWLENLGLADYADVFAENAIDVDVLPHLSDNDLQELGLPLGHRRKLQSAFPTLDKEQPSLAQAAGNASPTPEAERRQLTVMFCDLVGSTELSQKLDPEDLREVNRAYQDSCKSAIELYDGYVARYMGDGVLAYFGYPQAHENDAERAVHAGLAVIASVAAIELDVDDQQNQEFTVRVGIATGPVVVGDLIGEGASQESAVVGETPNLAARLQVLAAPNTLVICAKTRDLVAGSFDYDDLGEQQLKGIAAPIRVWRVVAKRSVESRFSALRTKGLTALTGREHEMGLLYERWEYAKDSDGQVILLCGEAGIGKSRIIQGLRERTAPDNPIRLRYQCSPFQTNSALYPVIEHLERTARFESTDPPRARLEKLEAVIGQSGLDPAAVAPLFASLLSISTGDRYAALDMSAEVKKERTLDALIGQLQGLGEKRPVLMVFEDVHWADPTSLELLGRFIERAPGSKVLAILSYRPDFSPPWAGYTHVSSLTLNRLPRRTVVKIVDTVVGGKLLPTELRDYIVDKTDGVPLFVEELTKTVLESELLDERGDHYVLKGSLNTLAIPSTLQGSLMARLDRLSAIKGVAQEAAAIGREFSFEMLNTISWFDQEALESALTQLIDAELVYRTGRASERHYLFKHALVQDIAYDSLLKSRRRSLHARIARALENESPQPAPELLAHHFTQAGLAQSAITYWIHAGHRAIDRSADREAVAHLREGLRVLGTLPASAENDKQELELQVPLFRALTTTEGWGSLDATTCHERISELCKRTGETGEHQIAVLIGGRIRHWVNAEYRAGIDVANQIVNLAMERADPELSVFARLIAGWPQLALGDYSTIRSSVGDLLNIYEKLAQRKYVSHYGLDLHVVALAMRAYQETLCGLLDQAADSSAESVALARQLNHAGSLVWALNWGGAQLAAMRGDFRTAWEFAEEVITLPEKQRSPLDLSWGRIIGGWALAKRAEREAGIALLRKGLGHLENHGIKMFRSVHLALLAESLLGGGNTTDALRVLREAQMHAERCEEHVWEPELHRIHGLVLLMDEPGAGERAAACFQQAIDLARLQGAKSLELRAATSLARLCKDQNKRDEARKLLAPVYEWFSEGFGSADLKLAKELLGELS